MPSPLYRLSNMKAEEIGITLEQLFDEYHDSKYDSLEEFLDNRCSCKTVGMDDGAHTCFEHHRCSDGVCTHQDVGDDDV